MKIISIFLFALTFLSSGVSVFAADENGPSLEQMKADLTELQGPCKADQDDKKKKCDAVQYENDHRAAYDKKQADPKVPYRVKQDLTMQELTRDVDLPALKRDCAEAKQKVVQTCGRMAKIQTLIDQRNAPHSATDASVDGALIETRQRVLGHCGAKTNPPLKMDFYAMPDNSVTIVFKSGVNEWDGLVTWDPKSQKFKTPKGASRDQHSLTLDQSRGRKGHAIAVATLEGSIPAQESLGNQFTMVCKLDQATYAQLTGEKSKTLVAKRSRHKRYRGKRYRDDGDAFAVKLPRSGSRPLFKNGE